MNYQIGAKQTVLGNESFGKVFLSESLHDKNFKVAIKAMDKIKLKMDVDFVKSEVAVLNKLDHPNIVNYYETYNDYRYVYLVMEFVKGKVLNKHFAE
jgi:calcium-dependent protein kinase